MPRAPLLRCSRHRSGSHPSTRWKCAHPLRRRPPSARCLLTLPFSPSRSLTTVALLTSQLHNTRTHTFFRSFAPARTTLFECVLELACLPAFDPSAGPGAASLLLTTRHRAVACLPCLLACPSASALSLITHPRAAAAARQRASLRGLEARLASAPAGAFCAARSCVLSCASPHSLRG